MCNIRYTYTKRRAKLELKLRLKTFAESLREGFIIIRSSGLFKVMGGILVLAILSAFAVMHFESRHPGNNMISDPNESFPAKIAETVWWAIITMTTVGYGDKYPITTGGRLVGVFVAFSGVALVSIFTATISSVLVARKIKEGKGLQDIYMKGHTLICGWNFNAESLLMTFEALQEKAQSGIVLVNDVQEDVMNDIILRYKQLNLKYVRGDFSNEIALNRANIKSARAVIVLPDASEKVMSQADEKTLLTVLVAKSLNPRIKVYAHILNPGNISHARHANIDEFILSDEYTGFLLANHVIAPGVPQFFNDLMNLSKTSKVQRVAIPENYLGKKAVDLQNYFKTSQNAIFLGLVSEEERFNVKEILTDRRSYLDAYIERKLQESGRGTGLRQKIGVTINPPDDYIIQPRDQALILTRAQ